MDAGLVRLVEGDVEILPGISVEVTGGHTKHHQIIFIKSKGETAVYFGGIVSSVNHVRLAYTMGFDLYPMEIARELGINETSAKLLLIEAGIDVSKCPTRIAHATGDYKNVNRRKAKM